MEQRLIIAGRLPGMNEMLGSSTRIARNYNAKGGRHTGYSKLKLQWGESVTLLCRAQGIKPVPSAHFRFTWIEPNTRRDPDNISAGKKLIFDGLVTAGVLPEDGWGQILSIAEEFRVDKAFPCVIVDIISD